jgi:hypothetical protein
MLTLDEVKLHLRVDHDAEDDLIEQYMDAAHDYVEEFLNRLVPWDVTSDKPDGVYPAAVRNAELQLIGGSYANREDRFVGTIQTANPATIALLFPYRKGLGV